MVIDFIRMLYFSDTSATPSPKVALEVDYWAHIFCLVICPLFTMISQYLDLK